MDFCRCGLVSTLVILKSCNPVILQLYGKQLLWNITDDHTGGKKKSVFIAIIPNIHACETWQKVPQFLISEQVFLLFPTIYA